MQRLFSGIQPSGAVGLGNYIGAIKPWLSMQQQYECLFCLVDLHTLTVPQDPTVLREKSYDLLALYMACGLEVDRQKIFFQSSRYEHAQLAWILNTLTGMGELSRMTQYKDKALKQSNVGLYTYPVLMAADILLYDADVVPVGADQKQHLELARDLAIRFNKRFGETFKVPEPLIPKQGARIMSLQDPTKKMSKSDDNANNYISLLDEPAKIIKKIKRSVTDSESCVQADPHRPGITNLLTIYSVMANLPIETIESRYHGEGYARFKTDLAELIVANLAPIQDKYRDIRADLPLLDRVIQEGAEKAGAIAEPKMKAIHQAIGLVWV